MLLLKSARPGFLSNINPGNLQKRLLTLVIADHQKGKVTGGTLSALSAASKLNEPIDLFLPSSTSSSQKLLESIQQSVPSSTLRKVIEAQSDLFENPVATHVANVLGALPEIGKYEHIIAPHSIVGKDIMPALAGSLGMSQISDVVEIRDKNTFVRTIYAGNAMCTVKSKDKQILFTARPTSFPPLVAETAGKLPEVQKFDVPKELLEGVSGKIKFVKAELSTSDRPELASAKIVISGGRALKNSENFDLLYKLADKLGAAVGASRAAVDAGYVPNDLQVGQTGKIVAPKLYIAVGISGAIQHIAGMKDAKVIVAINKDSEAPIFQIADYGLVGDLFKVIPELTEKI